MDMAWNGVRFGEKKAALSIASHMLNYQPDFNFLRIH